MTRITGRVKVSVNGDLLLNKEGATIAGVGISGEQSYELEEVMGDTGLHGFVEKPVPATLEVTVTDRDDILLGDYASIRENGTIVFEAAGGGKVYTMTNGTCTRNFSVAAGTGEVALKFIGSFWTEDVQ